MSEAHRPTVKAAMSPFQEEFDPEEEFFDEEQDNQILPKKSPCQLDIVGLLKQVAETHDLESVQSIKLKIMTKDLPLHSLHRYLVGLKELDLDCSNINSLRELGTDLCSLQVLRLGNCRLESLDGILAFKNLKEFSAPNNYITNLGLVGQLPHIIYFDISRNFISHWKQLSFFKEAATLEELNFRGNRGSGLDNYRAGVAELLPQLVILDEMLIDGRNPRKASPVLRAPEKVIRPPSGQKLNMNHDLCGNLTAALAQNKKRQKTTVAKNAGQTLTRTSQMSEPEVMEKAALAWKEAYFNFLTNKNHNST